MKTLKLRGSILTILLSSMLLFINCEKEEGYDMIEISEDITVSQKKITDWLNEVTLAKMPLNINGYYKANDGGHYYVRHIGNKIFWFGEHPSGNWANVFKGEIDGNKITGYFYDVPKGRIAGSGTLEISVLYSGAILSKTLGNNFGGSVWIKTTKPANLPETRPAGFGVRNDINNLTGRWTGNDGGYYYIRQIGNQVLWFGERNFTSGQPAWSNIAYGSRFYSQLWLDWVDVPKGGANSSGILRGSIDGANHITKVHSTGGFGGSSWSR